MFVRYAINGPLLDAAYKWTSNLVKMSTVMVCPDEGKGYAVGLALMLRETELMVEVSFRIATTVTACLVALKDIGFTSVLTMPSRSSDGIGPRVQLARYRETFRHDCHRWESHQVQRDVEGVAMDNREVVVYFSFRPDDSTNAHCRKGDYVPFGRKNSTKHLCVFKNI